MQRFLGIDHVDVRVRSLAAVEAFYDAIMPLLGLPAKRFAYVDSAGEWHDADSGQPYNAVEYHEMVHSGEIAAFVGFIGDDATAQVATRIAFRAGRAATVAAWAAALRAHGARYVELSDDMAHYAAVFFEDPAGTRLEICARNPQP